MGVEPNRQDFIAGLCLALAHRWEPERLFVVITIYLDESGTHDDSAAIAMAGTMANALQWSRFDQKVKRIQSKYRFSAFHTKEFYQRTGRFKGWTVEKCHELTSAMAQATRKGFMDSVSVLMSRSQYKTEYRDTPWPRKMRPDSMYGLCFRACLEHLLVETTKRCKKRPQIHVVLERGAKNEGDCQRIFWELQKDWPVLKTYSTAIKEECPPLWLGDMLATTTYKSTRTHPAEGPGSYGKSTPGLNSILHLRFPSGALARIKQMRIEQHEKRRAKVSSQKQLSETPCQNPSDPDLPQLPSP